MSARLLVVATMLMLGAGSVSADIFLLGDSTPIFSTATISRFPIEKGNQALFLRFAGVSESSRVVVRSGEHFSDAALDLRDLYTSNNMSFDEVYSLSPGILAYVDLLILGFPNWSWTKHELSAVSDLLARGGNVVIVVEPLVCSQECKDSSTRLLQALGSSLRIGKKAVARGQWGLLADHPFMRGIGPVKYGLTFSVEGGTELMYNADGLSMLSVDEELASACESESGFYTERAKPCPERDRSNAG